MVNVNGLRVDDERRQERHVFPIAIPCANLFREFGHMPGTDCARGEPHIGVAMPVLILGIISSPA